MSYARGMSLSILLFMYERINVMSIKNNQELDWNSSIGDESNQLTILPEGNYIFEVIGFERGRFPGGKKIPACNKAMLTLSVKTDTGNVTVYTDLILHSTVEWKLCDFFRSIGLKKPGERLTMDWDKVPGARGKAHFKPREFIDKEGNKRVTNDVDRYLDYCDSDFEDDNPYLPYA